MRFRKKPVVIDAFQWDGSLESFDKIIADNPTMQTLASSLNRRTKSVFSWRIETLEGGHDVSKGDFIIQGIKGEFYPCKPDIFDLTYEPA